MARCAPAVLALAMFALPQVMLARGHAAVVVVPDDFPTVQQAVDAADTVLVRSGDFLEPFAAHLGETGPRLIRRHPESAERPRLGPVILGDGIGAWAPLRLEGFEIRGGTRLEVWRHGQTIEIDACVLDSSIFIAGHYGPSVSLRLTRTRIHGGVGWHDNWLYDPEVLLDSDTLITGGVFAYGYGRVTIRNCVFQGPGDVAVNLGLDSGTGTVSDCRIEGYRLGLAAGSGASLHAERNVITDCEVGIWSEGNGLTARANDIRDCGAGIAADRGELDSVTLTDNLVLGSTGEGIRVRLPSAWFVDIRGNVVGRNGGHGLVVETHRWDDGWPPEARIIRNNTSYGNRGSAFVLSHHTKALVPTHPPGLVNNIAYGNQGHALEWSATQTYPEVPPATLDHTCNDWFANAAGSVSGTPSSPLDFELDPRFCDVASDSVSLQAGSPLLDAPGCGLIGARGVGCAATATVVTVFAVERVREGVQIRWRLGPSAEFGRVWIERARDAGGPWDEIATDRSLSGEETVDLDRGADLALVSWYRLLGEASPRPGELLAGPVALAPFAPAGFELRTLSVIAPGTRGRVIFALPHPAPIRLEVHDLLGRSVAVLARGSWPAGRHELDWPAGGGTSPGMLFVRFRFPGGEATRKVVVLSE